MPPCNGEEEGANSFCGDPVRKRRGVTDADVDRWLGQGFGQGSGDSYRPFLHVRDVPSEGEGWQLPVLLFPNRRDPHQFLSFLEASTSCVLEWEGATEVREQFAALSVNGDRSETIEIAKALDVRHPKVPGTATANVVTTDIVARMPGVRTKAVYVKPRDHLDPKTARGRRNLEKRDIEQVYWARRKDTDFISADEFTYPEMLRRNVFDLRTRLFHKEHDHLLPRMKEIADLFVACWTKTKPLSAVIDLIVKECRLDQLQVTNLVYRAAWNRLIPADLSASRFHPRNPVVLR